MSSIHNLTWENLVFFLLCIFNQIVQPEYFFFVSFVCCFVGGNVEHHRHRNGRFTTSNSQFKCDVFSKFLNSGMTNSTKSHKRQFSKWNVIQQLRVTCPGCDVTVLKKSSPSLTLGYHSDGKNFLCLSASQMMDAVDTYYVTNALFDAKTETCRAPVLLMTNFPKKPINIWWVLRCFVWLQI